MNFYPEQGEWGRIPPRSRMEAMPGSRIPKRAVPLPAAVSGCCVVGDMLCEVQVWPEVDWAKLTPRDRPVLAEYYPGLGWVAAVPARHGQ